MAKRLDASRCHLEYVGLSTGDLVLDRYLAGPSLPKKGAKPPNFRPMFIVAKGLDGSRWHLAWRWANCSRPHCARWRSSSPSQRGQIEPPQFLAHFYCGQTTGCIKMPLGIKVGLSPGDFVFDGDPCSYPRKRAHPLAPNFTPCLSCGQTAG